VTATATGTTGAAAMIRAGTATTKSTGAEAGGGAQPLTGIPTGHTKKVRPGLWPTPQAPLSR
jgi:hypothetical protein